MYIKLMRANMRIEELKEHYKTWTKLAKALDVGMNSHQYWRKVGYIPYPTQCVIQEKTKGLFKASLDDAEPLTKE
jgi:hypothetical protein